jgi:hypothetical protein
VGLFLYQKHAFRPKASVAILLSYQGTPSGVLQLANAITLEPVFSGGTSYARHRSLIFIDRDIMLP